MKLRGFLARWLYSVPFSLVGRRKIGTGPVRTETERNYIQNVRQIWSLNGGVSDGQPAPLWLRLTREADEAMRLFEQEIEPRLAVDKDLHPLAGWGNKLAGAAVRLAGVLHAIDAASDEQPLTIRLPASVVERAVRLARDYLLPHALAAFSVIGTDPRLDAAKAVLRSLPALVRGSVTSVSSATCVFTVSRRELHRHHQRRFSRAEDIDPV